MEYFSFFDLFYAIVLSVIIISRAKSRANKAIGDKPYYRWYSSGLAAKLFGTFLFCSIYIFYYKGGDTINYFKGVSAIYELFWASTTDYFFVMTNGNSYEAYGKFETTHFYPPKYMYQDTRTLLVLKLTSFIAFPALGGFFSTSVLLATITYRWVWKGFEIVVLRYPDISKQIAISFLFVPSVIFWGSGIMKDTYTFAATCFSLYGVYHIFVLRDNIIKNSIQLLLAVYLIVSIKSYILFALLPGILLYINFERIIKLKSTFVKVVLIPFSIVLIGLTAQSLFVNFGDMFGKYSSDKILEEAVVQQQDLTRDQYGSNSFDIGGFDASIQGVIQKIPAAINAALFRPYLWEVGSPTMMFSAIENMIILLASIYLILKIGPFQLIKYVVGDPYLIFAVLFSLILGFGIGLSTANFGALVRYKIPLTPFFISLLYILDYKQQLTVKAK
jgi:hypothetical protein